MPRIRISDGSVKYFPKFNACFRIQGNCLRRTRLGKITNKIYKSLELVLITLKISLVNLQFLNLQFKGSFNNTNLAFHHTMKYESGLESRDLQKNGVGYFTQRKQTEKYNEKSINS